MKLFLSSDSVLPETKEAFLNLVGIPREEIKIAFIENAADNYPPDKRVWLEESKANLEECAAEVQKVDLRDYSDANKLKNILRNYNVIWLGGGNVYYLRWLAKKSGLDQILYDLIQGGIVYGGESAGAIIASPTIDTFQKADDPDEAPEVILDGFHLTVIVPIPHCDYPKYMAVMEEAAQQIEQLGLKAVRIKENQAIVINGGDVKIVG